MTTTKEQNIKDWIENSRNLQQHHALIYNKYQNLYSTKTEPSRCRCHDSINPEIPDSDWFKKIMASEASNYLPITKRDKIYAEWYIKIMDNYAKMAAEKENPKILTKDEKEVEKQFNLFALYC